ncbi:hypothetical protein [Peptostreptococcus equinus]|uniref:GHMP kinase N-terminal domain-containing protein n=1 Tax=Peptostreptococcus equinus TaxID=3003601 RepID=A0ABY7JSQ7_9FIRM|nr:hypothetical protein [Peptostreptococcus sp. CBA3647]WAW15093.1 hypothetical protein O0R46_01200 [Peptostreptococcus sp. CBA3647]
MKSGFGVCPGTCGELVQGLMAKGEYISSYCIDLYSKAKIFEKSNSDIKNKLGKKSLTAIEMILDRFSIDKNSLNNLDIEITSQIPKGKGMASSTADIGACIMATLDFYDIYMSPEEISDMVAKIEPTDSIYYPEVCIFDPLKGQKKISLGYLPIEKVLILEPNLKINTVSIRASKQYYDKLNKNKIFTETAFKMLKKGFKKEDLRLIKSACENSALANESIKNTPFLRNLIECANKCDYGFLNIAHTGTVVGIGISQKTDLEKLTYEITNSDISKIYKKIYLCDVVRGGLRKEG